MRNILGVAVAVAACCAAGCGHDDPSVVLKAARPAYAEDPAEFLRLGRGLRDGLPQGSQSRREVERVLDEAPAYVFRHRFWPRLKPRPSKSDFQILAALARGTYHESRVAGRRNAPSGPWESRLNEFAKEAAWSLAVDGPEEDALDLAYLAGRIPVFDPDLSLGLSVASEASILEKQVYGMNLVERRKKVFSLSIRGAEGNVRTERAEGSDPPLPSVLEFTEWRGGGSPGFVSMEPRNYRRADADALAAAGIKVRTAIGTTYAPLELPRRSTLGPPDLWGTCARMLEATDYDRRPRVTARELRLAVEGIHTYEGDQLLRGPMAAEVRELLDTYTSDSTR